MAPPDEPTTLLEIEQRTFRECKGMAEDLAAAFGRAAERDGGLSASELAQLRNLASRAAILLSSVAWPVPGSLEDRNGR